MSGTIKYCISTENHYFKLHLKYGFKTGGGMIIINMRKHYKPSSKGIFMSLGFLIKKSARDSKIRVLFVSWWELLSSPL